MVSLPLSYGLLPVAFRLLPFCLSSVAFCRTICYLSAQPRSQDTNVRETKLSISRFVTPQPESQITQYHG